MKTKEIDVWVRPDELDSNGISCQTNKHDKWQLKAKLVVEVPEKKITISESEFRQMYKELCREAYQQKSAGDMWEPNTYMEYALKFEDK